MHENQIYMSVIQKITTRKSALRGTAAGIPAPELYMHNRD